MISFKVCLFKISLDQAINATNTKNNIPIGMFIGNIKKDKKILSETCKELFIK